MDHVSLGGSRHECYGDERMLQDDDVDARARGPSFWLRETAIIWEGPSAEIRPAYACTAAEIFRPLRLCSPLPSSA